jgi:hypothetical protein
MFSAYSPKVGTGFAIRIRASGKMLHVYLGVQSENRLALLHSSMWRNYSHRIHVIQPSVTICVAVTRLDSNRAHGVTQDDLKGETHERNKSSGVCCRRRIAPAGGSGRACPGAVAEQSRRRGGNPGRFEADHDRSALGRSLAPLASSALAPSLVVLGALFRRRVNEQARIAGLFC